MYCTGLPPWSIAASLLYELCLVSNRVLIIAWTILILVCQLPGFTGLMDDVGPVVSRYQKLTTGPVEVEVSLIQYDIDIWQLTVQGFNC